MIMTEMTLNSLVQIACRFKLSNLTIIIIYATCCENWDGKLSGAYSSHSSRHLANCAALGGAMWDCGKELARTVIVAQE